MRSTAKGAVEYFVIFCCCWEKIAMLYWILRPSICCLLITVETVCELRIVNCDFFSLSLSTLLIKKIRIFRQKHTIEFHVHFFPNCDTNNSREYQAKIISFYDNVILIGCKTAENSNLPLFRIRF